MTDGIGSKKRLPYIDILKVIGLLLVILAHVDLPIWLAKIRSFDVPLLVFLSACLARNSFCDKDIITYYKKRIFRLAIPAWIFAIVFWIVQSIMLTTPLTVDIIKGLTFQRDTNMLGMLWIIWVYLVCAFLVPVIDKMKFTYVSQSVVILLLAGFQALCSFTNLYEKRFLYCTLFTVIPYGFITYLGYYYKDMNVGIRHGIVMTSAMIFIGMTVVFWVRDNVVFPVTDYKYPAQLYYISYGILCAVLLIECLRKYESMEIGLPMVQFISKSSLWIYLWHILVMYAVKMVIADPAYWWVQYLIIVPVSVGITLIQNKVVDLLLSKYDWKLLMVFKG